MSGEGALPYRPAIVVIDGPNVREPDTRMLPCVAGRRDGAEWRVWISNGEQVTELDVARARQFAADVLAVCGVIEGAHGSGAPAA